MSIYRFESCCLGGYTVNLCVRKNSCRLADKAIESMGVLLHLLIKGIVQCSKLIVLLD
nr:MAG TPA: hypothetical protein [Caudoviricetes sp.]